MMKYKGYIGKVEFDAEADILHGEVAGIRDVVTFQGRSVEEMEKAFRDQAPDLSMLCEIADDDGLSYGKFRLRRCH